MIGSSRAQRKASAALRAQLALRQAFERIDYDFDVVRPQLEKIKQLEVANVVDVEPGQLETGQETQGVTDANLGHA